MLNWTLRAGSEYITGWRYGPNVVLTGSPLSPMPGNPGSPLRPGFPCRATVLPMSAGSTGHTSHGSPCRWNISQTKSYVDERAQKHADEEIIDRVYRYLLSFKPCWSSWSLWKQQNPSQTLTCISSQLEYCILDSHAYITEYKSIYIDLKGSHWISWKSIFSCRSCISL